VDLHYIYDIVAILDVHTQFKCELTKIYAIFNNYLEITLIKLQTKVASTCSELLEVYIFMVTVSKVLA
jgi:hypothetical protein